MSSTDERRIYECGSRTAVAQKRFVCYKKGKREGIKQNTLHESLEVVCREREGSESRSVCVGSRTDAPSQNGCVVNHFDFTQAMIPSLPPRSYNKKKDPLAEGSP